MKEQNEIQLRVPREMEGLIEDIRSARAAKFEETTNKSIAREAVKALYEREVMKGASK